MDTILDSISHTDLAKLLEGNTSRPFDLSDESIAALYTIAYELYRNSKWEEAKKVFLFLTHAEPLERKHWMGLAASTQMLKDFAAAIEYYSVAAIQDPNDPYVHWHAAECFFALNDTSKAKIALESALTVAKNDQKHHTLLSQLELIQQTWNATAAG